MTLATSLTFPGLLHACLIYSAMNLGHHQKSLEMCWGLTLFRAVVLANSVQPSHIQPWMPTLARDPTWRCRSALGTNLRCSICWGHSLQFPSMWYGIPHKTNHASVGVPMVEFDPHPEMTWWSEPILWDIPVDGRSHGGDWHWVLKTWHRHISTRYHPVGLCFDRRMTTTDSQCLSGRPGEIVALWYTKKLTQILWFSLITVVTPMLHQGGRPGVGVLVFRRRCHSSHSRLCPLMNLFVVCWERWDNLRYAVSPRQDVKGWRR